MDLLNNNHVLMILIKEINVLNPQKKYFSQKNLSTNKVWLNFMQFNVDYLNRTYIIKEEDITLINQNLINKIYNSKFADGSVPINRNFKQFISDYMESCFENNIFLDVIKLTEKFHLELSLSKEIPENDQIRASSLKFLSFFLEPLATYYLMTRDPLDFNESKGLTEFNMELPFHFENFIDLVTQGAQFKDICVMISTELCLLFEKNPQVFINEHQFLSKLTPLLLIDNAEMLSCIIEQLTFLCSIDEIKNDMIKFFYNEFLSYIDEKGNKLRIPLNEILHYIATQKNLQIISNKMIFLFIAIAGLGNERLISSITKKRFLIQDQRYEIYKSKIAGNIEITKVLIKMMTLYEDCVFTTLIDIFTMEQIPEGNVNKMIHLLENYRIESVAKIITESLNDPIRCKYACMVFTFIHENFKIDDEQSFLYKIHEYLIQCFENEQAFIAIADFILSISPSALKNQLSINQSLRINLFDLIFQAFSCFEYPKVLDQLTKLIKFLKLILPSMTNDYLIKAMYMFYGEFIEIEALQIAEIKTEKTFNNCLLKMTLLYDSEIVIFCDYFEYDAIFITNRRHLLDTNNNEIFVPFAYFQTTILKHSFNLLINQKRNNDYKPFPVTIQDIMDCTIELREKLLLLIDELPNYNDTYTPMLILKNTLELLHFFYLRPMMTDYDKNILSITQPQIKQETFEKIIVNVKCKFLEHQNADEDLKYSDIYFSQQALASVIDFLKNYSHALDLTPLHLLIPHILNKNFRQTIIELLILIEIRPEFSSIIGLTIMKLADKKEHLFVFEYFMFFMSNILNDKKHSKLRIKIIEFILKNLDYTKSNRLEILKYIKILIKHKPEFNDVVYKLIVEFKGWKQEEITTLREFTMSLKIQNH